MPPNQAKAAGGCLALFALPFLVGGSFFVIAGLKATHGSHDLAVWIFPVVGAGFALFGLMMAISGVSQAMTANKATATQAAYANQPWMWRKDWAQGRAQSLAARSLGARWLFALIWNALWLFFFFMIFASNRRVEHLPKAAYFMLLFPLIGLVTLFAALRSTVRVMRYGRTFLQLQTLPVPLGRSLKGTIEVPLPYPLPHGIHLSFTCVNRVTTGAGKQRSTTDYIRWRANKLLGSEQIMAGPSGSTIPIDFDVPRDMPGSDTSNNANAIYWFLRAQADVPGVNFDDKYEVPVFETSDSPTLQDWEAAQDSEERSHPASAPIRPTVRVSAAPEGGTAFYFPAGRNFAFGMMVTLFALVFTATECAIVMGHGPFLFMLVFGLASLFLLVLTANAWFGTARVVASGSGITATTSLFGYTRSKMWTSSQLRLIHPKISSQSAGSSASNVYYAVTLTDLGGREYPVGIALRDQNEAEWICEQIRQLTNIQAKTAAQAG